MLDDDALNALVAFGRMVETLLRQREQTMIAARLMGSARAAERHFRLAFDQLGIAEALVAPDGRLLRLNQRAAALLGGDARELPGRSLFELAHPDERVALLEMTENLLSATLPRAGRVPPGFGC